MSEVTHVTFEVTNGAIIPDEQDLLVKFMSILGFAEVPVEEDVPKDWRVRWFWFNQFQPAIHVVERPSQTLGALPGAGHICVDMVKGRYENAVLEFLKHDYVERNSGNGRCWLNYAGIRVELRDASRTVVPTGVDALPGAGGAGPEISADVEPEPSEQRLLDHRSDSDTTTNATSEKFLAAVAENDEEDRWANILSISPEAKIKLMNFQRQDVAPEHWGHSLILDRALEVYKDRDNKYQRNWQSQGWRGNLFKLRLKVERAWTVLWHFNPEDPADADAADTDDLIDLINYAVFAIRNIEDGNRDGSWNY